MEEQRAATLLKAERARLEELLAADRTGRQRDLDAVAEQGDVDDVAQPLTTESVDEAIDESLRDKLAALERAEARLQAHTYGTSVRSGDPIPDERLEAEPTAELTVEEATADPDA